MGESSKYDFAIPDNPGGTHGMILQNVPRNSTVLECGCASGYMTKYMQEKLGCIVSIVEIDYECCRKAKAFANDWYCGDLNEDGWRQYYSTSSFDCILFADVLEHLPKPLETLKKAASLLKRNGKIIISIPNICHNDILVRMFYDHWNYSDLGLLDNTHIHFWGGRDLAKFCNNSGLRITKFNGIMIPTQMTEQRYPEKVDDRLLSLLKERELGEMYQYVICCEKKEVQDERIIGEDDMG